MTFVARDPRSPLVQMDKPLIETIVDRLRDAISRRYAVFMAAHA